MLSYNDVLVADFNPPEIQNECIFFSDSGEIYLFIFNSDGSVTSEVY